MPASEPQKPAESVRGGAGTLPKKTTSMGLRGGSGRLARAAKSAINPPPDQNRSDQNLTTPEPEQSANPEPSPKHMLSRPAMKKRVRLSAALLVTIAVALCLGTGVVVASYLDQQTAAVTSAKQAVAASAATAQQTVEAAEQQKRENSLAADASVQTDWATGQTDEKICYLTFDDGPSDNTEPILDILDEYGINATFFVTGHDSSNYDMIGEAYRRGNSIGLHSMTHDYSTIYTSTEAYYEDLAEIGAIVEEQIGFVPFLVRFPGGSSNTVSAKYCTGIMTSLSQSLIERGYQYYDWNAQSGDAAGSNIDVDVLVAGATNCGGNNNVIVLMHDSADKGTTVEALPQIIEYYQEQGYTFKAIDRSSYVHHHGVNN